LPTADLASGPCSKDSFSSRRHCKRLAASLLGGQTKRRIERTDRSLLGPLSSANWSWRHRLGWGGQAASRSFELRSGRIAPKHYRRRFLGVSGGGPIGCARRFGGDRAVMEGADLSSAPGSWLPGVTRYPRGSALLIAWAGWASAVLAPRIRTCPSRLVNKSLNENLGSFML